MKEKLVNCLAFLTLILLPSSVKAEELSSATNAVASCTIGSETKYYSTLPEVFDVAKGKTATITMIQSVDLGTTQLKVDDDNTNITLNRTPVTRLSNRINLTGENSESLILVSKGKLTIVCGSYLDFFIWNDGTTGGVCAYVKGSGKLIADGVDLTSRSSYAILQMSSQPVEIKGKSYIRGGERLGKQYTSVFSNSSNSKFCIEGGRFASGLENNAGSIKEWLSGGKAFYTSSTVSSEYLYVGSDSKCLEDLRVLDCIHTYEGATWTYENNVASCNCVICNNASSITDPAVLVKYQVGAQTFGYYSEYLDQYVEDKINNKVATITILKDTEIKTSRNEFSCSDANVTFIGNDNTLKGKITGKKIIIKNGKYDSGDKGCDCCIFSSGLLHIYDGQFTGRGNGYAIYANGNEVTIDGGDFCTESTEKASLTVGGNGCNVTINGGCFRATSPGVYGLNISKGTNAVLNGGTFPVSIDSDGKHCGGLLTYNALSQYLGEGKAFYVNRECTKYLLDNDIYSQKQWFFCNLVEKVVS